MSRTHGLALGTNPLSYYETPADVVDRILPKLPILAKNGLTILDAGCGTGAILSRMPANPSHKLLGVEADAELVKAADARLSSLYEVRRHEIITGDFLDLPVSSPAYRADVCLMNPPFPLAQDFIKAALTMVKARGGEVAALLRLGWLEGRKRHAWIKAHPPDVFVLPDRPSFTGDGKTDATAYAFMVWGPTRGHRWELLSLAPPKPRRKRAPKLQEAA